MQTMVVNSLQQLPFSSKTKINKTNNNPKKNEEKKIKNTTNGVAKPIPFMELFFLAEKTPCKRDN